MIRFTKHAEEKFKILFRHGLNIDREKIIQTVKQPDLLDSITRHPLLIAQSNLDSGHVLRVVYRQEDEMKIIITFYPGRKRQYG